MARRRKREIIKLRTWKQKVIYTEECSLTGIAFLEHFKKSVANEPNLENLLLQTLWRLWLCNPDPQREGEREIEILEHTAS